VIEEQQQNYNGRTKYHLIFLILEQINYLVIFIRTND